MTRRSSRLLSFDIAANLTAFTRFLKITNTYSAFIDQMFIKPGVLSLSSFEWRMTSLPIIGNILHFCRPVFPHVYFALLSVSESSV